MKKLLPLLLIMFVLVSGKVSAQEFTTEADTVWAYNYAGENLYNHIRNHTGALLSLKWKVVAGDIPNDWLVGLGICDASGCLNNGSTYVLWNGSSGQINDVDYRWDASNHDSDFHYVGVPGPTTPDTCYLTVNISTVSFGTSKNITFVFTHSPTGISNVAGSATNVLFYPNPASNFVNVVYSPDAGVKNIAVHNIIGNTVSIYKVSGNSARLPLDNIPPGIYFLRLLNAQGTIIATRRFTRQ